MKNKRTLPIILLLLVSSLSYISFNSVVYGDIVPRDFLVEVAKGTIEGHSQLHKFGHNPSVGSTWEDVWDNGTIYPFLTSATKFNITSTDVDDVAATEDTGAWNVTIYGLDSNYAEQNETIQLNGQNNVTTTNLYLRVFRMIIEESGTTGTNEGDIYCGTESITDGIQTNVYAQIMTGDGQTLMAIYTIPSGYTAFIMSMQYTADEDKAIEFAFFTRPYGGSWNIKDRLYLYRNSFNMDFYPPREYSEKTDIVIRSRVSVGTARVSASFCIVLVDNDVVDTSVLNWADGDPSMLSTRDQTILLSMVLAVVLMGLLNLASRRN